MIDALIGIVWGLLAAPTVLFLLAWGCGALDFKLTYGNKTIFRIGNPD